MGKGEKQITWKRKTNGHLLFIELLNFEHFFSFVKYFALWRRIFRLKYSVYFSACVWWCAIAALCHQMKNIHVPSLSMASHFREAISVFAYGFSKICWWYSANGGRPRNRFLLSCIHFNLFLAMTANDWADDDKHGSGDKQTVSLCFCIFYKNH